MSKTEKEAAPLPVRSNAGLDSAEKQKLEYFKSLAQRLCKHDWMQMENKDGSRFSFCRICTLINDDI